VQFYVHLIANEPPGRPIADLIDEVHRRLAAFLDRAVALAWVQEDAPERIVPHRLKLLPCYRPAAKRDHPGEGTCPTSYPRS
jgi:hypothetical protein